MSKEATSLNNNQNNLSSKEPSKNEDKRDKKLTTTNELSSITKGVQKMKNMMECEKKVEKKMEELKISKNESKLKEYPDSDYEDDPKKGKNLLKYGTISNYQAENLEKFYQKFDRFPSANDVKDFVKKFNLSQSDAEIWLETRRELTYRNFLKRGLETDASVIKFYSEAMKLAEGVRLEQPSIRSKSFFSHQGINEIETKKELEEKEQPTISVSTNKIFFSPKNEAKNQIIIKNNGEVNVVYQISMINAEKYIMTPICAILQPAEELTLNISRKPGPILDEFFRIDYGRSPEGVIDAREAADRAQLTENEIIQIVAIDEKEMKVIR